MSDQFPNPSDVPGGEPEYLGSAPVAFEEDEQPRGRGPRWGVVAAASAAVVATAGFGGWGVAQLMAGGSSPASAVPAIAVAYLSVDLDPSATQKIEAIQTLKQFPGLADQLDLDARDDVRRWVFEELQSTETCKGLDYERDIEPWLGDRMALAAVPDDDAPLAPLVVVQVKDREAARAGVAALEECTSAGTGSVPGSASGTTSAAPLEKDENEPSGVAFVGDYMLVTEHQDDADAMATAAEAESLEDDAGFSDWMERVGEPGFVTAYASADAPRLMIESGFEQGKQRLSTLPDGREHFDATGDMSQEFMAMHAEKTRALWKDFDGMAAVVRFDDGSVEAEMVGRGLPSGVASGGRTGPSLADLPAGTAAAFSVSLTDGWLQPYLDSIGQVFSSGESAEEFWTEVEADTGLQLPEDVEAMLGDGFSISVDASVDLDELGSSPDVPRVPVAMRISGDPAKITASLDKLLSRLGPDRDSILVESGEGVVVVGLDPAYVDELLGGGDLGDLESFQDAVPEADRAAGALYVNFDVEDWALRLAEGDPKVEANVAPLHALGISGWRDDDGVQHGLFRLATD